MATISGDIDGDLVRREKGGSQVLEIESDTIGTAFGDATGAIEDRASGGNDLLDSGDFEAFVYGDAYEIRDRGQGGRTTAPIP